MTSIDSSRRTLAAFGLIALAGLAAPAAVQAKSSRKRKDKPDSQAQRQKLEDARLTRECRGRPNSGACLGYAR
jgi:hypothetical protein